LIFQFLRKIKKAVYSKGNKLLFIWVGIGLKTELLSKIKNGLPFKQAVVVCHRTSEDSRKG